MPRASKRAQLARSIVQDTLGEVAFADSGEQMENALMEGLESYELAMAFRCSVPRIRVPKSDEWYSSILSSYDDERFKHHVRVTRRDFGRILSFIQDHEVFSVAQKRQTPIEKQLAIALYKFGTNGTGSSIGQAAAKFGVGDGGTISKIMDRVITALVSKSNEWIVWPDEEERKKIASGTMNDFPHCLGFVDGSHIDLEERPRTDPEAYYDRKQNYSLQLQAVCDWEKRIRHIHVGYPGSTHDARVFVNSEIGRNPQKFFSEGQWIAGDSAYPVGPHMLTPFRKNATYSTPGNRKKFNHYFASRRVRIECCFGILKETFGSLKQLRMQVSESGGHQLACRWICACCVLYNMITEPMDAKPEEEDDSDEDEEDADYCRQQLGEEKRRQLFEFVGRKRGF